MEKAIGIDFGLKRTGLAITDDLGLIASPLVAVPSE
ncbi:MAG: Holliday junction resolvase, partial [Bacteroidota bacterium]